MSHYTPMENRPLRQRRDYEAESARRRDRETARHDSWTQRARYYETCERQNAKFEAFTSPRYYEDNNRLHDELKAKKDKEEHLTTRREALRKLFMADQQTYDIELMMAKCSPRAWDDVDACRRKADDIPIALLKQVHEDVRAGDEERRRQRAETALYEQWRRDDPQVASAARRHAAGAMKMSWLDQQVERRMAKEKEEAEMRTYIADQQRQIEARRVEEETFREETEERRQQLRDALEQQMDEILRREEATKRLKDEEDMLRGKQVELRHLQQQWEDEERRKRTMLVALENQRSHKRQLQLKNQQVLKNLEEERAFIKRLQDAEVCEKVENEKKRAEIQDSMNQFLALVKDLKELEDKRRLQTSLVFDSEACGVLKQYEACWRQEEAKRQNLVTGILQDLKAQMDANCRKAQEDQQQLLREREEMIARMQAQKEEIETLQRWKEEKKDIYKRALDEQVADKRQKEATLKKLERDNDHKEIERLRNEEKRLKDEILKVQQVRNAAARGRRLPFY